VARRFSRRRGAVSTPARAGRRSTTADCAGFWQNRYRRCKLGQPIIDRERDKVIITLNDEVCKQHLRPNTGCFEPTPQWDNERSQDWLWSRIREEKAAESA